MNCKSCHHFFTNLANKTKLDIILALTEGPLNVTKITKKLEQEQSKISHNLKTLTACNILQVKPQGKERIYSLNKETVLPLLKLIEKHTETYCSGGCCK